jgi:dipeptidyl aminopeptidase/acylaminoacyl peptidase
MKKTIVFIILCSAPLLIKAQVTIENLLSVPFPTELKSSANGKKLAWVFNDKGVRNVFIAEAPDFKEIKITNNTADDGIEISNLAFTPNGLQLLFTEGNTKNKNGEAANPAQLQRSTAQAVWIIHTDGSGLHKLAAVNKVSVSPDGNSAVYSSGGKAWQVLIGDTTKKPVQLFEARGIIGSIKWSPDGKQIAFISNRGDHAFVGLYQINQKTVEYPDPSVDIDMEPAWSPDGKWLAWIRVPNQKDVLPFTEQRKGYPWSVRLLSLATMQGKEIWKADEGMGSVLYTDIPTAENLLLWGNGNTILFPWEKDGWQHIYKLDVSKKGPTILLTPGKGEVEQMTLSADSASLIYTTNIGDTHRRHIWKVGLNGEKPVQLSKGNGIEWSAVNIANGIAVLQSTATRPAWPGILQTEGSVKKIAVDLFPAAFPENLLVTPRMVSFHAKDGLMINGQLFLPPGYQQGKKYPALLFFHGGSRRQMLLGFHYMDYYSNDYAMNQYYASRGYIVLAVNYRSGIGYGMEFREALHYGANGGSEYQDVVAAGLFLKSRADVDATRIGLWGGSYGGYLTAMGLARNADIFKCGVDIHGVHNWDDEMQVWVSGYDPATRAAFSKIALQSSPVYFVNGWRSPVLFIHGDDDRNVGFSQTVNLIEKLRERNVHIEQLVIPDEIHSFLLHKTWLKGYSTAADFFERMLK